VTSLIILGLLALWKRRAQAKDILRANAPVVVFLLYCLVSALWADYPFVTLKRWIRAVADIVMVLVILTDPAPEAAFRWVLSRVAYVLVPLSVLLIRFYPEIGRWYSPSGEQMWTGVGTSKNGLGALCMVAGIGVLWNWLAPFSSKSWDRIRQRIALGTVFLIMLYLLWISDSKTALMCFLLASTVFAIPRLFLTPSIVSVLVVGIIASCYAVLIAGVGGGALEAMGRNASLTGRTRVWVIVRRFVENPWLGAGYESFWIGERQATLTGFGGNQAHNGYLEIYLNLGWVGVMLLTVIIATGYRNVMTEIRSNPALGRLKVALFLIGIVYNFTEAGFKMMSTVWIVFLWATMAVPTAQLSEVRSAVSRFVTRRPNLAPLNRSAARPQMTRTSR